MAKKSFPLLTSSSDSADSLTTLLPLLAHTLCASVTACVTRPLPVTVHSPVKKKDSLEAAGSKERVLITVEASLSLCPRLPVFCHAFIVENAVVKKTLVKRL